MPAAVNCLPTEAVWKIVSGVTGTSSSIFARPYPLNPGRFPVADDGDGQAGDIVFLHRGTNEIVHLVAAHRSGNQRPPENE